MRSVLAVLLLLVPGASFAQTPSARPETPATTVLPPIGLPLPPIGLSLPPIGLAPSTPTPTTSPRVADADRTRRDRRGDTPHRRPSLMPIYVVPAYGVYAWAPLAPSTTGAATPGLATAGPEATPPSTATPASADRVPSRPPTGTLRLELQPRATGQLFLDDAYVGTLDELGTEFTLAEGRHQLEIRQPGFRPFTLTVRIDEGRALVYRGELERIAAPSSPAQTLAQTLAPAAAPAPAPPIASIARKPFYFIPGCYLGDVPPKDAGLPATCDQSRAVVFRP